MMRSSFSSPRGRRTEAQTVRESESNKRNSPKRATPKAKRRQQFPEFPLEPGLPKIISDEDLEALLPDDDQFDPYPEPGDFWTEE